MRRFLIILCILCAPALYAQDITNAVNLERYANTEVPYIYKVVFIGNSITEAWVKTNPDFFISNGFVGRGISGQTTSQLLLRFRQDVLDLKPKAVVINAGTNDIAENTGSYNPRLTMDCIQSMAELAHHNGIKVILSSVLPAGEFPWRTEITDVSQKVDELNELIRQYANENKFPYIDYNTPMRNNNGALIKQYTYDGVHPTKEGYQVMEKLAGNAIEQLNL